MFGVYTGSTVYFADKNALKGSLVETLVLAQPTIFFGVPRVWEKFHEKMMEKARSNGAIKTWIAKWAKNQGLHYYTNKMNGVDYKHWGYVFAKWLVFDKVKAALGLNKCYLFISAAAPISMDIKKYFLSLDMPLSEAYGMSESSGPHTITDINNYRYVVLVYSPLTFTVRYIFCLILKFMLSFSFEGVGITIPNFYTKIDNMDEHGEGEICISGRHIFMGYLNAPDKTAETKDKDGWLHTGDFGKLDLKGNLHITGEHLFSTVYHIRTRSNVFILIKYNHLYLITSLYT